MFIIEETRGGGEIEIKADITVDLRQSGDWIQMDETQALQLVELLQKWINGEVI